MRHADPYVTLKHYQREVPSEVKAAAIALEKDLLAQKRKRKEALAAEDKNTLIV
jgi:hypothetical protein